MAVKMPDAPMTTRPDAHGVVTKDNRVIATIRAARHLNQVVRALEQGGDLWRAAVMVAPHQMNFPVQSVPVRTDLIGSAVHGKIAQMPDGILGLHPRVPGADQGFVHFLSGGEWTVAVFNNVGVAKVSVGREKSHVRMQARPAVQISEVKNASDESGDHLAQALGSGQSLGNDGTQCFW